MTTTVDIPTARVFVPLLGPARYKGAHGGRGSGKSHFFGDYVVDRALVTPGLRVVCIREVQRSLEQSVKRLLADKIERLGVRSLFDVQQSQIKTPGDGVIIFTGMQNHTSDTIKSLEGYDMAWFEEAQKASQRSLDLLTPTLRKDGSELLFSWNATDPSDPVDQLLRGASPPPDSVVVKANWHDNPWFPDVLRAEMEWMRDRDPAKYAHIWLGEYRSQSEAQVFRNWRVDEFETPGDARLYYGADWGFAVDPTCLVRCWIKGRTLYFDHEAYAVGCEIDATPALFDTVPGARRWPIVADSARPETIAFMRRHGFPNIRAAKKGKGSVEDGVAFLQSFDIVVHPRCRHLIDELATYSWKVDPRTDEVLPVLADRKNHLIDAARYALEGARRAVRGAVPTGDTSPSLWTGVT